MIDCDPVPVLPSTTSADRRRVVDTGRPSQEREDVGNRPYAMAVSKYSLLERGGGHRVGDSGSANEVIEPCRAAVAGEQRPDPQTAVVVVAAGVRLRTPPVAR